MASVTRTAVHWLRTHWKRLILLSGVAVFLMAFGVVVLGGYTWRWYWVGIVPAPASLKQGKTLWDWMQLLIAPAVLAGIGYIFTLQQRDRAEYLAREQQREAVLQTYFDQLSDMLSKQEIPRTIARIRTLLTLRQLDGTRKGLLMNFLLDAKLVRSTDGNPPAIDLSSADLSSALLQSLHLEGLCFDGVNLEGANLIGAFLNNTSFENANLKEANLIGAELRNVKKFMGANLQHAHLMYADLRSSSLDFADLRSANLKGANLLGATFNRTQLDHAIYNKGTRWPPGFKPDAFGAVQRGQPLNGRKVDRKE